MQAVWSWSLLEAKIALHSITQPLCVTVRLALMPPLTSSPTPTITPNILKKLFYKIPPSQFH